MHLRKVSKMKNKRKKKYINKEDIVERAYEEAFAEVDEILKMMMQPPDEKLDNRMRLYECTCCGRQFDTQKGNFSRCASPLFQANDKYLPVCDTCLRSILSQYALR